MLKRKIACLLAIFGCSAGITALADLEGVTDDFKQGRSRPVTVGLLPIGSTVVLARVARDEDQIAEGALYGEMFTEMITARLSELGYEVVVLTSDKINADGRLQEYVLDLNRVFDESTQTLRIKPRLANRIKKREYAYGDDARLLAARLNVDSIVLTRLDVEARALGKKLLSGMFTDRLGDGLAFMGFIDRYSGDMEAWLTSIDVGINQSSFAEDPGEVLTDLADELVKGLPEADPSRRSARMDNESVLEEIEALLDD